jgi:hypothetical protein
MNTFDHYAAARNLINLLEAEGLKHEALILRSAMEEGSTGTEILMALRFHLTKILQVLPTNTALFTCASSLLNQLNILV